jgi:hypothetical protein
MASLASAWGPVAHAVIGDLAETNLLKQDAGWHALLARLQQSSQHELIRQALLGVDFPAAGQVLAVLGNWPDAQRGQPGMLPADGQRHYVNLPYHTPYSRALHCSDGVCSIETLLQQRTVLADRRAPMATRAVALAWVAHLVADMHQPLHAGKEEDRGGNLTCVTWRGEPSALVTIEGKRTCTGANLHAVWDGKILEAMGFTYIDRVPALAQELQRLLPLIKAAEPPLTARTDAEWRTVIERWHAETQASIVFDTIYPMGNTIDESYMQCHYHTIRRQLLRAAVRLAALLHQTLQP